MPIHQPLPQTPCHSPFSIVIRKLSYMLELLFVLKPSPVSGFLLTVLKLDVGVVYHVLGALSLCHGDPCLWMPPHLVQRDMRHVQLLVVWDIIIYIFL